MTHFLQSLVGHFARNAARDGELGCTVAGEEGVDVASTHAALIDTPIENTISIMVIYQKNPNRDLVNVVVTYHTISD